MELKNGRITMLISGNETTIELKDADSSITFCKITLTPEQLSEALSRLYYTHCNIEIYGLDKLGKTHENKRFTFELPKDYDKVKLSEYCNTAMIREGLSDWTSDDYYKSQDSFYRKDGKEYARVTIRRWV
jgi:hypothetical protein